MKQFIALVFGGLLLLADVPTASVSGTITDSSGGIVTSALVEARNVETKVSRTTTTNESGNYQLLGLQTGRYEISVSHAQFTTVRRADIVLRVGDEIRIDVSLPIGETTEAVV